MRPFLLLLTASLLPFWGYSQTTVTKTFAPATSVSVDGCGTFCNALAGVDFTAADFANGSAITEVKVTIIWAKTGGTCSVPDTTASEHGETSFRLDGPAGQEVILAQPGTWSGQATTDTVTTVFDQAALVQPADTPVNGTFLPNNGDLGTLRCASPLGTWTLRAGDNGAGSPVCIGQYSVEISAVAGLETSFAVTDATCEGDSDGSATVTVNGGMPPYSYAWDVNNQTSATATNLATGPNIVTVTDAMGCARVDTVMVGFQFAAPMVDLGNDTTGAGPIVLRAGNFAGYEWQNASTADTFVVTSSGTYFVIVTDANGCQGSDTIVVNLWPVGTGELPTGGMDFGLFPNPASETVMVSLKGHAGEQAALTVHSITGQEVMRQAFLLRGPDHREPLDVQALSPGLYLVRLRVANQTLQRKLVVR